MTLVPLDIVLVLPENLRGQAITCSKIVCGNMEKGGSASYFQLGQPYPGHREERCEPHVSLFMLAVDEMEVDEVTYSVEQLAKTLPSLDAQAAEYGYNPHGAVEVYFTTSSAWCTLQRSVITAVEPFRRGRLRAVDASGARIRDVVDHASLDDPRRQQLLRYGYDEVADQDRGGHNRFSPHITLAWPRDHDHRATLHDLPDPRSLSGPLTELAVFGMSAHGTCTRNYGVFTLGGASAAWVSD
jgi:hypothetical protein